MKMHPITVLHLVLSLEMGGAETVVTRLIGKMNPDRFRLAIICLCSRGPLADLAEKAGARVIMAGPMIRGASLVYPYKLLGVVRQEKPDILHSHSGCGPTAALLSWYTKIPQIHTEHGRPYPDPRWMIEVERFYAQGTKKIIAVSPILKKSLAQAFRWPEAKIMVIENGVDTDYFSPQPKPASLLRELGIRPDQKIIGTIGRLSRVKNHPVLLRAFRQVLTAEPRARLLIVGDGPERKKLEQMISELDLSKACCLLGERFDILNLLSCLDVFVLPSWSEGTSLSLLEAMSCARAVVASRVGGNCEIIRTGQTGFLIPPHDVRSLALHIQTLLHNRSLAVRLGMNARKMVVRRYRLNLMVEKYQKLYRQILST